MWPTLCYSSVLHMQTISSQVEENITNCNRALVAASRRLSSKHFETAHELKLALNEWLEAKCATLEAYSQREFESSNADAWINADRMQKTIGTYNEVQERLAHITTIANA